MDEIGKPERETQRRLIKLFREELHYKFRAGWSDRDGNSNIEEQLLADYLERNQRVQESFQGESVI